MPGTLHLVNGTSIVSRVRETDAGGRIVSWDDVLHEGPVPIGLNPAALRERRADFLASCGWGATDAICRSFAERDAAVATAIERIDPARADSGARVDEIVLWFEFDLFDQLQLLQILDRLPLDGTPRLTAVAADDVYLGHLKAARFRELFAARRDVTSAERLAARDAWTAFRSPDPRAIVDALPRVTAMPHLAPALRRHLQQFPSIEQGLSRTEKQAMQVVAEGVTRIADVYVRSHHGREEAVFMGDMPFVAHISALVRSPLPLLEASSSPASLTMDDQIALTDAGRRVLAGDLDRVRACGIDRWLGGVQLSGTGPIWRWDESRQTVRLA